MSYGHIPAPTTLELAKEIATLRAELAGAIKSRGAAMLLYESSRQSRDDLLMHQRERQEALRTLDSERAANALLTAQLAAAEARADELSAMLDHQRDEATEMERMLRAGHAKAEARAERLARLLLDVDNVATDRFSEYGACDCVDNYGSAYQSQTLDDELRAIRAALAEEEVNP